MNIDLIITLRAVLNLCVLVVWRQKQPLFFLHCHNSHSNRLTLFNELCEIDMNLPNLSGERFLNIILNGSSLVYILVIYECIRNYANAFSVSLFTHIQLKDLANAISIILLKRLWLKILFFLFVFSFTFSIIIMIMMMMMMMMMMIMMMITFLCGMVDQWKVFSLIFSLDHCQRSTPSQISDMSHTGLEPVQNLSSVFVWRKLCSSDNHYIF